MATAFFQKKQPGQIGQLIFDVVINETHALTSTVTTNPVEDGKTIADNIVNEPENVTMEGFITNSPVTILGGILNGAVQQADRVQTAFDALYEMWTGKTLLTVVTGLKIYKDMAVQSINIPRDGKTDSMQPSVQLSKIVKVKSQTVGIPKNKVAPKKRDQGQSTQDAGQQNTQNANSQQKDQGQSWLYGGLQSGGFIN